MNWSELRAVQRAHAALEGPWSASGKTVLRGSFEIARCADAETATVIAGVFNAFGPLVNGAIMLQRRLRDLREGKL